MTNNGGFRKQMRTIHTYIGDIMTHDANRDKSQNRTQSVIMDLSFNTFHSILERITAQNQNSKPRSV